MGVAMGSDPNPCSASLGIIPRSRHGFFGLRPEHDEFLFVKPAVGDELLSQWHLLFSAMPEGLAHSPALPSLMPKDVGYDPTRATGKGSKCRYDSEARIRTRQAVDFLLRSTKADGGHGLNERACTPCMLHIMFSSKPRDFFLKKKFAVFLHACLLSSPTFRREYHARVGWGCLTPMLSLVFRV